MQQCLAQWPPPLRRAVRRYLASRPGWIPGRTRPPRSAGRPAWLELPIWLYARFAPGRPFSTASKWLRDVQWAQYCLFLFVRIHDDFVDEQGERLPELVVAADRLLFEAETCLARRFSGDAFWGCYRRLLATSLEAIATVAALQRRRRSSTKALLEQYARVSSVFKVGAAAVCVACRRSSALPFVERLADELAVANQIVDDLMDIEEDLARGRVNYAATVLAGDRRGRLPSGRHLVAVIARRAFATDGLAVIVAEARRHVAEARRAAAALDLPEAVSCIARFDAELARLDEQLHLARVSTLFGSRAAR